MIARKIIENARKFPDKVALRHFAKEMTYRQLRTEIAVRVRQITSKRSRFLLVNDDPIATIIQLLAYQVTQNASVVIGADVPEKDVQLLRERYRLCGAEEVTDAAPMPSDDYFLGVLTSGSSGVPKLIWKDNDCWEAAFGHQSAVFGISEMDTVFTLDALAYSANLNAALHALWAGASVQFTSLQTAGSWQNQLLASASTSIFLVPSHLNLLNQNEVNLKVNSLVTAGEKLSVTVAKRLLQLFPNARLTEYYGAAELGHVSFHQNDDIINNPLSVGKAFPGVKISITDRQLHVQSPYLSPEYKALGTVNDLGYWEKGRLILLGRAGRMFNRRGLNIYAQEIEQKALGFPGVRETHLAIKMVDQRPHLCLFYVSTDHKTINFSRELATYLRAVLPSPKRPQKLLELPEIPRLPTGKINVQELQRIINSLKNSDRDEMTNGKLLPV